MQPFKKNSTIAFIAFVILAIFASTASVVYFRQQSEVQKRSGTSAPPNISLREVGVQSLPSSEPIEFMYGYVIGKGGDLLMIQELLPLGLYGASIYIVHVGSETTYGRVAAFDTNQKKIENARIVPVGERGNFAEIKKKMYVFFVTKSPLRSTPLILAEHITYSESNPFPPAQK